MQSTLLALPSRDRTFASFLAKEYRTDDNGAGKIFRRAHVMGSCLADYLRNGIAKDKNRAARMVLTGAYGIASRRIDVDLYSKKIAGRAPRERVMALLTMALAPRRATGAKRLLSAVPYRKLSPVERIATAVALARLSDFDGMPSGTLSKKSGIGELASVLYAHADRHLPWVRDRIKQTGSVGHQDLVWRGYFLGARGSGRVEDDRRSMALSTLRDSKAGSKILRAAAWNLSQDPKSAAAIPGEYLRRAPMLVALLCARSRICRAHILRRDPLPSVSADLSVRKKWMSLFALYADPAVVRSAVTQWKGLPDSKTPEVRQVLGLALAARMLQMPKAQAKMVHWDTDWLSPQMQPWLAWARGDRKVLTSASATTGGLGAPLTLALAGRLQRSRAAELLERELWRMGSHPARVGASLHRQFLGEILLDGCPGAGGNFVESPHELFTAAGIGRGDEMFRFARAYFNFVAATEPWSFSEFRF